jgi:hypothetical protein
MPWKRSAASRFLWHHCPSEANHNAPGVSDSRSLTAGVRWDNGQDARSPTSDVCFRGPKPVHDLANEIRFTSKWRSRRTSNQACRGRRHTPQPQQYICLGALTARELRRMPLPCGFAWCRRGRDRPGWSCLSLRDCVCTRLRLTPDFFFEVLVFLTGISSSFPGLRAEWHAAALASPLRASMGGICSAERLPKRLSRGHVPHPQGPVTAAFLIVPDCLGDRR